MADGSTPGQSPQIDIQLGAETPVVDRLPWLPAKKPRRPRGWNVYGPEWTPTTYRPRQKKPAQAKATAGTAEPEGTEKRQGWHRQGVSPAPLRLTQFGDMEPTVRRALELFRLRQSDVPCLAFGRGLKSITRSEDGSVRAEWKSAKAHFAFATDLNAAVAESGGKVQHYVGGIAAGQVTERAASPFSLPAFDPAADHLTAMLKRLERCRRELETAHNAASERQQTISEVAAA